MSSSYNPFGLRPAYNSSGIVRPGPVGQIESGYATSIFQGYPVVIATDGYMTAAAAGDDTLWNGCFSGVEYNDLATGRRFYLNHWTAAVTLPLGSCSISSRSATTSPAA